MREGELVVGLVVEGKWGNLGGELMDDGEVEKLGGG